MENYYTMPKYTVHSLEKKKKLVKWNAAWDNYLSAQKLYRFGSTMTPAYTHLLYLQIKRNKGT